MLLGPEFVGKVGTKVSTWSWGLESGVRVRRSWE